MVVAQSRRSEPILIPPSTGETSNWSLVTVTYNSEEMLRRYAAASEIGDAQWIVVDNASIDDSVAVARQLGAEVIALKRNIGFSAANNIALGSIQRPWLAFVNPDITISSTGDLPRLAQVSGANRGLVAPQLVDPGGTEQPNGRGWPFLIDKLAHRGLRLPGARLDRYVRIGFTSPTYIAWAMGAAIAGPTALFRELGGWNERYFVYYEDHDLGLTSWRLGHTVVLDPGVRWIHEWQRATKGLSWSPWRHELRSAMIFYRNHPRLLARTRSGLNFDVPPGDELLWTPAIVPS